MPKKDNEQKEILDDLVITGGGNVVGGDTFRISGEVVNLNIHGNAPIVDIEQLKSAYLVYIQSASQTLGFRGISVSDGLPPEIPIENIYVPLSALAELPKGETWARNVPLAVQDVVQVDDIIGKQSKVVILGDAGSGKTTLLKNFALNLAKQENAPLPILVPLSAYAESLARADRNLQQFFGDYFSGRAQGISNLEPLFDAVLSQGQAIVLLDGLDECDVQIRSHLVSKIESFANEATRQGNKVVVTSRIVGYREASLDSKSWSLYTLLDFSQAEIAKFVSRWFMAFELATNGNTPQAKDSAERHSRALIQTINSNTGLQFLASNPLMLTVLGLLFYYNASLPLRRVDLYEQYLKTLINTWNRARALDSRAIGQSLDYYQTVTILGKFAFWLRAENPQTGIITEEQLLEWLTNYYSGVDWQKPRGEAMISAREFVDSVRKHSNILIERGHGYYGFVHIALEEHLAARGLIQLPTETSIEFIDKHQNDPYWREVIISAIGLWGARGQLRVVGEIVKKILATGDEGVKFASMILEQVGEQSFEKTIVSEIQNARKNSQ